MAAELAEVAELGWPEVLAAVDPVGGAEPNLGC